MDYQRASVNPHHSDGPQGGLDCHVCGGMPSKNTLMWFGAILKVNQRVPVL